MDATNVTRQLTGFAARLILGAAMVAGGLLLNPLAASALFTQCPPVGLDTGCAVLIVFNPDGSRVTVTDPSQPPFDGTEDTLIGVQNNSGGDVGSLTVTGTPAPLVPNIGDFDGDGLCQPYVNSPAGCPYGTTRYEGRVSTTVTARTDSNSFPAEVFTVSADKNTVTVDFTSRDFPKGIPNGGSAYFSLEGPAASVAPPLPLRSCTLSPATSTNPVDTKHTVTATVRNTAGNPVSGQTVLFTVTGAVNTTGSCTTDTFGTCSFTYTGPALPGADAITACVDTDKDGRPCDAMDFACTPATKAWTVPLSTAFCTVDITYGGWITARNGDRANFGGNASADEAGNPSGQEEYQDNGPVAPLNVHSISVLAVTCTTMPPPATGSIFGQATIDGSGSHVYRIDLQDGGAGVGKYEIRLDTGYDSGNETLKGGKVTIHK